MQQLKTQIQHMKKPERKPERWMSQGILSLSHSSSFIKPEIGTVLNPMSKPRGRNKWGNHIQIKEQPNNNEQQTITLHLPQAYHDARSVTMQEEQISTNAASPARKLEHTARVCCSPLLLVLSCLAWTIHFSSTDHDFLSTNLTLFSMMTTFFSFLSAVLHLWIAILRPVMQSVSMNVAISLFIRLGHVEGLGEEGWHDAVFVVCFSPFACALRTLFVAPIPLHRLFSW